MIDTDHYLQALLLEKTFYAVPVAVGVPIYDAYKIIAGDLRTNPTNPASPPSLDALLSAYDGILAGLTNSWLLDATNARGDPTYDIYDRNNGSGSRSIQSSPLVSYNVITQPTIPVSTSNVIVYDEETGVPLTLGDGNNLVFEVTSNELSVGNGNNTILLTNGDHSLHIGSGDNLIIGGNGSDIIYAGSGTQEIYGGNETTLEFSGSRSDYSVTAAGTGDLLITDNRPGHPDGTELVSNISDFVFQDATYTPATILDPIITGVTGLPSTGDEGIGKTIQISLTFSEQITVTGAAPSLTLNDGGTAVYASGSGTNTLTFNYTVASTDASVTALAITGVNNAASVADTSGNAAVFSAAPTTFTGLQIGAAVPAITVPAAATAQQNAATAITGVSLAETGTTGGESFTVTLADSAGNLAATGTGVSGAGTSALTISGSLSQVNADLATLTDTDISTAADTIAVNATDSFGNTAAQQTIDVTVTVTPQSNAIGWKTPISGNWNTASNWSPATVPGAANQVNIAVSGNYTVTINSSDVAQGVTLNAAGATVSDNRGGTLTLAGTGGAGSPNGSLTITSGTFDLNGGALKAGSISTASGATLLIAGGVLYTGANSLGETITDNGAITVQSLAAANFTGAISGAGAITVQSLAGAAFGAISGSESVTIQNGAAATFSTVSGSEAFKVQNLGLLTVTGAVSGSESVSLTSGALAVIKGAVTDQSGTFSLANSAALEFVAASNASVTFGSGSNTLKLDDSKQFTGTLSGLTKSDTIDLADLSYVKGKMTASYSGTTAGGTLTVSNGATSVNLALVGNYTTSTWTLSSDGKGGTNVVDPPAPSSGTSGSSSSADIAQTDAGAGLAVGANATLGFQQGSQNAGAFPAASQGGHAALALLAQYTASSFALGGGDHGGAVVSPSPIAASPLLVNPHSLHHA